MDRKLIDIVVGARPNFMKIAPIIHRLDAAINDGVPLRYRLVHTGQHYDARMSGAFFEQLRIPKPHINLEVGSGTQAEQTAGVMVGYERLLHEEKSNICIVVGDVTSTMACAITAQKELVPVGHVEAGIRSGDWTMPEEINRIVTDSVSNWFFTTSTTANANLAKCGISEEQIFFVGNTMIDTLLSNMDRLSPPDFWDRMRLRTRQYFVLTLHRPANVDTPKRLLAMLLAVAEAARELPIVLPIHPRTKRVLGDVILPGNVRIVDAQPYLEFNYLVKNAFGVITDSGGVTEETTVMGVPCITLRDSTERPETVEIGTNELIGTDPAAIRPTLDRLFAGDWKKGAVPEKWDGGAGERIMEGLRAILLDHSVANSG